MGKKIAYVYTYISWEDYRKLLRYCELESTTKYGLLKKALLYYLEHYLKTKYPTPLISDEKVGVR